MDLIIGDSLHDLAALRLSQIQQFPQIKLLQDDIHSNCSICICSFIKDEIILILPCVHKFHTCCIQTWLSKNNTCPTCRENVINGNDISDINEDENSDGDASSIEENIIISDDSSDSSETSTPAAVVDLISSYFDSSDESSPSDMSFDQHSISISIPSINSSFSIDINTTTEIFETESDDNSMATTVSNDSDTESQTTSSSNESSDDMDASNAMFPSSADETSESPDNWEMSDDSSD